MWYGPDWPLMLVDVKILFYSVLIGFGNKGSLRAGWIVSVERRIEDKGEESRR